MVNVSMDMVNDIHSIVSVYVNIVNVARHMIQCK
jgi:hypothetical protein